MRGSWGVFCRVMSAAVTPAPARAYFSGTTPIAFRCEMQQDRQRDSEGVRPAEMAAITTEEQEIAVEGTCLSSIM
jgi:hypothetical protein